MGLRIASLGLDLLDHPFFQEPVHQFSSAMPRPERGDSMCIADGHSAGLGQEVEHAFLLGRERLCERFSDVTSEVAIDPCLSLLDVVSKDDDKL